jgi:hypothetical protein
MVSQCNDSEKSLNASTIKEGNDMPRYAITEKAGPFVATYRNTGVGTVLELTEHQAAHELRLGTLTDLDSVRVGTPQPRLETPEGPEGDAATLQTAESKPRRNARA